MTKKEIIFVRHGAGSHQHEEQEPYTCDKITVQSLPNLPISYNDEFYQDSILNTKGHEQATKLGLYFNSIGKSFDHIFSSPSRRVIETCDHVVKKKNIFVDDNLIEIDCTNMCNRKHNREYLTRFIFPRDNCYNLGNVNDDYNPDKIIRIIKNIEKLSQATKKLIIPIIEELKSNLYNFFKDGIAHDVLSGVLEKFDESDLQKNIIKPIEIISFLRISNFIENILQDSTFVSGKIIVFTHGQWIKYLKKLYLNINEDIVGNCTCHILNLENLDSHFINLLKEANKLLINPTYDRIFAIFNETDKKNLDASQYPDNYVIDENYKCNKYKFKYAELKDVYPKIKE
jgi:broad specificity phosphatase PhoE